VSIPNRTGKPNWDCEILFTFSFEITINKWYRNCSNKCNYRHDIGRNIVTIFNIRRINKVITIRRNNELRYILTGYLPIRRSYIFLGSCLLFDLLVMKYAIAPRIKIGNMSKNSFFVIVMNYILPNKSYNKLPPSKLSPALSWSVLFSLAAAAPSTHEAAPAAGVSSSVSLSNSLL
jgi:hypothetical protein